MKVCDLNLNIAVIIKKRNNGDVLSYWEQKLYDFWSQRISSRRVFLDGSPENVFLKNYGNLNIDDTVP
mgnify:CR=1 FL=1